MSYKYWLVKLNGSEYMKFPVNPETLEIKVQNNIQTYDILNLGEVIKLKELKLERISFKSIFPKHYAPYVSENEADLKSPIHYANLIRSWQKNKTVLRFITRGDDLKAYRKVVVTNFSFEERGGEVGDLYYDIELTEYKDIKAKEIILKTQNNVTVIDSQTLNTREDNFTPVQTYTVVSGDTLWAIAKRLLNDGSRYPEIAELNSISNVNLINVGQILRIPEV